VTLRARVAMTVGVLAVLGAIGWAAWRLYAPASDTRAKELLRAAAQSLHHTAVQGTVITRVYLREGWREARAEVHRGGGRAQVRYLDGPAAGTTVYRQGRDVWAVSGEGAPSRRVDLPADPTEALARHLLHDHYHARVVGERIIAGRPAVMIEAGGARGRVALGVDRETSFPLLMERYDADGQLRVSTVYESADFSGPPPPPVEPPEGAVRRRFGGQRYNSLAEAKGKVSFTLYQPGYIPAGFELQGVHVHDGALVNLVGSRYSDGLNWFVIVQRAEREGQAEPEPRRHGAGEHRRDGRGRHGMRGPRGMMHLPGGPMGDAVRRAMDGTVVLVMGSVPRDELARIADSLKPVP